MSELQQSVMSHGLAEEWAVPGGQVDQSSDCFEQGAKVKREQVQNLKHGLYRVQWKEGGESLAAVGSKYNGDRWLCCANWTSPPGQGTDASGDEIWSKVEKVFLYLEVNYDG